MGITLRSALLLALVGCDSQSGAGDAEGDSEGGDPVCAAKVGIVEALATAEGSRSGGVVLEAEFDRDDQAYEFEVAADGQLFEVMLDVETGELDEFEVPFGNEERASLALLETSVVTLADAAAIAEAEIAGCAEEVEIEDGLIEVSVVVGNEASIVHIRPSDGQIIDVADDPIEDD